MEKELRKNQSILRLSGRATIIFELWSIIKWVAYCINDPAELDRYVNLAGGGELGSAVVIASVAIAVIIDGGSRLYVGLKAIKISKGKKCNNMFLLIASLIVLLTLYVTYATILPTEGIFEWDYFLLAFILDLSSLLISVELLISAIKIRSIEDKIKCS